MLIVCPTCATTYQIQLAALGAAGRSVRCSHCKNTWFATPGSVIAAPATALVPAARRPAAPSSPPRPPADDFSEDASDFSVEAMPPEDAVAADEAHTALDEIDAPPLAPENPFAEQGPSAEKFEPGAPEDVETIAARRARHSHADRNGRRSVPQRVVSLPMLIVVLLAILGGVLQWRVAVVRQFPQTASLFSLIGLPVNLRGLIFQDVRTRGEFVDGVMVLVTEGTIVNLTTRTLDVPRLRFGLRNSSGHEVYGWTAQPPKSQLASGNGLAFRTRLASPPPDGRDVIVRFFNRRDASLSAP